MDGPTLDLSRPLAGPPHPAGQSVSAVWTLARPATPLLARGRGAPYLRRERFAVLAGDPTQPRSRRLHTVRPSNPQPRGQSTMAKTTRSITSILGIIALILVIVAAVYFIMDQADDNEIEIDLGAADSSVPELLTASFQPPAAPWLV